MGSFSDDYTNEVLTGVDSGRAFLQAWGQPAIALKYKDHYPITACPMVSSLSTGLDLGPPLSRSRYSAATCDGNNAKNAAHILEVGVDLRGHGPPDPASFVADHQPT